MRALMERAVEGGRGWRRAHPKATFREIEGEVEARLAAVRREMVEELAQESSSRDLAGQWEDERPRCEQCGGELAARGQQDREVMTLRGDRVQLRRSYAVCRQCGAGVFPPR